MSKFNVGDRVITTEDFDFNTKAGLVGTIVALKMTEWGDVAVEFDERVSCGHNADGKAKNGHGRYGHSNGLKPIKYPKIVITTDGTETLARLYEGNKVVKSATAKCSPADKFDFNISAKCAFDRLTESPAEKKEKYYNGKVVCVECEDSDFTVGKIYEFIDGTVVDNNGTVRYKGFLRIKHPSEIVNLYKFIPLVEEKKG